MTMGVVLDYGGIIRARRAKLGISQEALAELAGLDPRTGRNIISHIETGRTARPSRQTWTLLCMAMGCNPLTGEELPDGISHASASDLYLIGPGGERYTGVTIFDLHSIFRPGDRIHLFYGDRDGVIQLTQDGSRYLWVKRAKRKEDK